MRFASNIQDSPTVAENGQNTKLIANSETQLIALYEQWKETKRKTTNKQMAESCYGRYLLINN